MRNFFGQRPYSIRVDGIEYSHGSKALSKLDFGVGWHIPESSKGVIGL